MTVQVCKCNATISQKVFNSKIWQKTQTFSVICPIFYNLTVFTWSSCLTGNVLTLPWSEINCSTPWTLLFFVGWADDLIQGNLFQSRTITNFPQFWYAWSFCFFPCLFTGLWLAMNHITQLVMKPMPRLWRWWSCCFLTAVLVFFLLFSHPQFYVSGSRLIGRTDCPWGFRLSGGQTARSEQNFPACAASHVPMSTAIKIGLFRQLRLLSALPRSYRAHFKEEPEGDCNV